MSVIVVTTTSYSTFKALMKDLKAKLAYTVSDGTVTTVTVFDAERVGVVFAIEVAESTFLIDFVQAHKVDTITIG